VCAHGSNRTTRAIIIIRITTYLFRAPIQERTFYSSQPAFPERNSLQRCETFHQVQWLVEAPTTRSEVAFEKQLRKSGLRIAAKVLSHLLDRAPQRRDLNCDDVTLRPAIIA
jgi:hypothetical protein